jgi:hypothetical protein
MMKASREEMKQAALSLMEALDMGENFINELRDEGKVGMSEQWYVPPINLKGIPGRFQRRVYFGIEGTAFHVYPYIAGLTECDESPAEFEERTGHFVWHMHYLVTSYGRLLSLFFISNRDQRFKEGDEECNTAEFWQEEHDDALKGGCITVYCKNLDNDSMNEFGDVLFCITDNGCLMRLS